MPDNTSDFSALYSGNASIYSVYNLSQIPHIDANLTSLVKHSVKHLFNLYFFTRIINLL